MMMIGYVPYSLWPIKEQFKKKRSLRKSIRKTLFYFDNRESRDIVDWTDILLLQNVTNALQGHAEPLAML